MCFTEMVFKKSTISTSLIFLAIQLVFTINTVRGDNVSFYQNYEVTYGYDHLKVLDDGRLVQLYMDKSTGCGFKSKSKFGSGFFHINMKIPNNKDFHGFIPNFYLTSSADNPDRDELDFEFYGNDTRPILLQTNIFIRGTGNREQKIALWFDPREQFHSYTILWNRWHVVFFVDNIPIREFKNLSSLTGTGYPSRPMELRASLWAAPWAAQGRAIPWNLAPFISSYTGFNIYGCPAQDIPSRENCLGPRFWWNRNGFRRLSHKQKERYENIRRYIVYDYCTDKKRHPVTPLECRFNS